jgi:hypothetical protein
MTTRRRITTGIVVTLGLATSASPALARSFDLNANGSYVPAGSPSVANQATIPATPPTIVHVSASNGGFDWGDAGIGAAAGFSVSMIGVGGALATSQRRGRRTRGTALTS